MLLVLYCIHLVIYFSSVYFFRLIAPFDRRLIFCGVTVLALCVIISAILQRLYSNGFTSIFYLCGAVWLGIAINLFLVCVIGWIVFVVNRVLSLQFSMSWTAAVLTLAALVFSVYGIWNAFHPRIKEIDVKMAGLPAKWLDKKIVLISDAHLGAIYSPRYFSGVAAKINSLKPDIIFITGDLFDSISADGLDAFVAPLNELVATGGVFYVNGNHENYIGMERVSRTLAKTRLRTLRDEVAVIDGVQIIGVDYPDFASNGNRDAAALIRSRKEYTQGLPTILLYHTPTSFKVTATDVTARQTQTYWAPDTDFTAAKALGVNLQLSGHTHEGQMLPFVWLARRLYKGYEYGLHTDGPFSIYITSGLGSFGPPMRTATASEIVVIRLKQADR